MYFIEQKFILIQISLLFAPKDSIGDKSALV